MAVQPSLAPDVTGRPARSARTRQAIEVAALLLVGLGLRVVHLGQPSLWNDELFSRFYYDLFGPGFLLGRGLAIESSPPTYYLLLEGWMRLFGSSEAALRALSVAASLATVGLVWLLARSLLSARAALLAAWLAALCPLDVLFAQEARTYALLLAPYTVAMLGLARFLQAPQARAGLLLYALGAVGAIACHVTMVIVVAGLGAAGLLHLALTPRPGRGRAVAYWLLANAAVLAIVLPGLWVMRVFSPRRSLAWMPPLSPRDVAVALSSVATNAVVPLRLPGAELAALLGLALGAALLARNPSPAARSVLLVAPAVGLALMLLASLRQPVLLPRTVLWATVPLCVLIAHGLSARSAARPVLLAATVLAFGSGLLWQVALTDEVNKTPWRRLFTQNGADMRRADLIVLGLKATPLAAAYYLPGARVDQWRGPMAPSLEGTMIPSRLGVPAIDDARLIQAIGQGGHVWLIAQWDDIDRLPALLARVRAPSRRIDFMCGGRTPCLSALDWDAAP